MNKKEEESQLVFLGPICDKILLDDILLAQPEDFQTFLRRSAVYGKPVLKKGIGALCGDMKNWESHIEKAVKLSIMEVDSTGQENRYYVNAMPEIREELFKELEHDERKRCHQIAVLYYQTIRSRDFDVEASAELIVHAIHAGQPEIAVEESGSKFLPFLRKNFAYEAALIFGHDVLRSASELKRDASYSKFILSLGNIYRDMRKTGQALEYFEHALSINKKIYGERHPDVAIILNNIGEIWHRMGKPEKAKEYYEQSFSIYEEVYGDRHPEVALTLNNIGWVWSDLGETAKAIDCYEQALSIYKEVYGERHTEVAGTLNNIGRGWRSLERPKKAMEYYEQAYTIYKNAYGDRHPEVALTLNNIGSAWHALGETRKALECHEQALSINRKVYGDRHPEVALTLNNVGGAWYKLGDFKKAREYFQQAYEMFREFHGDAHPLTINAENWLDLSSPK